MVSVLPQKSKSKSNSFLDHVRTTQSFFLSIGIHFGIAALLIGAMSIIHKKVSMVPEKTKLKILLNAPEPADVPPVVHLAAPQQIQQPIQKSEPQPLPKQPEVIPQIKTPLPIQTKSVVPAVQTVQAIIPPTPKPVESVIVAAPKAPPSPPKVEENYEEENLGKIRSILAERLKYPKNAQRLKQQGECVVTFTLEPSREVHQITVTQSSGFELLDDAAKELIENSSSEFPKPKRSVRISVPISYKLR